MPHFTPPSGLTMASWTPCAFRAPCETSPARPASFAGRRSGVTWEMLAPVLGGEPPGSDCRGNSEPGGGAPARSGKGYTPASNVGRTMLKPVLGDPTTRGEVSSAYAMEYARLSSPVSGAPLCNLPADLVRRLAGDAFKSVPPKAGSISNGVVSLPHQQSRLSHWLRVKLASWVRYQQVEAGFLELKL